MIYPRFQFSKHLHSFLMSYDYCSICATCAINGMSGRNIYINKWKLLKDDLKCYISTQNNDSNLLKQISVISLYYIWLYHLCHL